MNKTAFHVHTYRCGHAENIPDEAYVKKAVELGAEHIWFTDHAPFLDNPFGARMQYSQLKEYIQTLCALKKKYSEINIHIGLETEYFPSYDKMGYYQQLRSIPELEMLLLGQHMAEISDNPPGYSFSLDAEQLCRKEYQLLGNAIIQGIKTGYFNAVAHPDRIFRRCTGWNDEMKKLSSEIISTAVSVHIPLEMNLASFENSRYYRREFWQLVPEKAERIVGLDAHSLYELESRYTRQM
ncbi:MAG: PHP domain-containing protein [Oscillospiraceae bacterium]|nr:PHP domain-containing protein [Oscillospiraceae bacterium]